MSKQNKLQVKKQRREERAEEVSAWAAFPRNPLSQFPREAAINALCNPLAKSTATRRKRLRRALQSRVAVPRLEPRDPAAKLTFDLQRETMSRLVRRIQKSARRAATCKNLAEKLTPGNQVRVNLEGAQTAFLGELRQARAEYLKRLS